MLLEKITAKDVQIGLAAADWEDAIRQAAAPLRDAGDIEQSYIEGMIESVHKNGPYFVLARAWRWRMRGRNAAPTVWRSLFPRSIRRYRSARATTIRSA